jgi:hypothetical protein
LDFISATPADVFYTKPQQQCKLNCYSAFVLANTSRHPKYSRGGSSRFVQLHVAPAATARFSPLLQQKHAHAYCYTSMSNAGAASVVSNDDQTVLTHMMSSIDPPNAPPQEIKHNTNNIC